MPFTSPIPCRECERKKIDLTHLGCTVLGCLHFSDDQQFCVVEYHDPHGYAVHEKQLEPRLVTLLSNATHR